MKFNKKVLDNGLKIITIPTTDNLSVTVLVMVETGSIYETKEINGISHFLEHMLFKGTKKRPRSLMIAKELESLGAEYNAFTAQEFTGYYAKVDSSHLDVALDVVSDIYLNPLFDEKEIEKEKGVITEEIKMYQDMPHKHVQDIFIELVYGDQPAGWNVAGTEDNVRRISRDNLIKYHDDHYVASATSVFISGSFDEKTIIQKVEKAFGQISIGNKLGKLEVRENQSRPGVFLKYKDTDQAHMVIGVRAFGAKDEDAYPLNVLSAILGRGMSSRLFQKLREEMGVGYYVNAGYDAYTDHGLFTISTGVDTSRIEEVIRTILDECHNITTDGVSEDELKRVKDFICGLFILSLETSDSRAEFFAGNQILKGQIILPSDEIKKIQAVSIDDVRRVAGKIFINQNINLAVIGPYKDKENFSSLLYFSI